MKRKWLLTSFEPFAGRSDNHSQTVLNEIKMFIDVLTPGEWPFEFHYAVLPVEYDRCYEVLKEKMNELGSLEGVLSIGEGAEEFKIETQANNYDDVPDLADNAGTTRKQKKIIEELKLEDTIPFRFPFEAFQRIRSSKNPGYYICNHLCARMAYEGTKNPKAPYFGFIHVPRTGQGGVFTADVCAAMIVNSFRKLT